MSNFIEKSYSAMRLISGWMALSVNINKICAIGQQQTHMCFKRNHCTQHVIKPTHWRPCSPSKSYSVLIQRTESLVISFTNFYTNVMPSLKYPHLIFPIKCIQFIKVTRTTLEFSWLDLRVLIVVWLAFKNACLNLCISFGSWSRHTYPWRIFSPERYRYA